MKNKNLFFLLKTPKLKKEKTRNINFVDQTTILNSTIFRTNIESQLLKICIYTIVTEKNKEQVWHTKEAPLGKMNTLKNNLQLTQTN